MDFCIDSEVLTSNYSIAARFCLGLTLLTDRGGVVIGAFSCDVNRPITRSRFQFRNWHVRDIGGLRMQRHFIRTLLALSSAFNPRVPVVAFPQTVATANLSLDAVVVPGERREARLQDVNQVGAGERATDGQMKRRKAYGP